MLDAKFLLSQSARKIGEIVSQYGVIVFMPIEKKDLEKIATKTIFDQHQEIFELQTFFMSTTANDPSYAAILFDYDDTPMRLVRLRRTIIYDTMDGTIPRTDKVIYGPMVPKELADVMCEQAMLVANPTHATVDEIKNAAKAA